MSTAKYEPGEVIRDFNTLLEQEFVYWNNKITHRGWVQSWQIRMTVNALQNGTIRKAVLKEPKGEVRA